MKQAIKQMAYLMSECGRTRSDACSDAAQYYGINENELYAATQHLTLWAMLQVTV